jgi:hypothetical protein
MKSQQSIPTKGFSGLTYDSALEASVSCVLKDKVKPHGGYHFKSGFAIKYQDQQGKPQRFIPDFELSSRKGVFIEAKGNLDRRSRSHIGAALAQGYRLGVVFPSEKAAALPLWPSAYSSKGDWLNTRGIPFVTNPKDSLALYKTLEKITQEGEAA